MDKEFLENYEHRENSEYDKVLVGRLYLIGETCPTCDHKIREAMYSLQPFREQYDSSL